MKFQNVFCSQCGQGFGPGNEGFSSCKSHEAESSLKAWPDTSDYVFFFPVWIAQDSIQVHIGVLEDEQEYVVINRWGKVSERLERLLTPADRREIESKIADLVREESEYKRWEHLAPDAVSV